MKKYSLKKKGKNRKRGGTKNKKEKSEKSKSISIDSIFKLAPVSPEKKIRKKIFTIMTFNVESWLNLIRPSYNQDKTYNDIETDTIRNSFKDYLQSPTIQNTNQKWQQLKTIISNVDILCVQEDALIGEGRVVNPQEYKISDEPQTNFIENIGELKLVSSCKSHPYLWPDTLGLYYSGSKLSNTIYSKYDGEPKLSIPAQLTIDKIQTINNEGKNHHRCWAVSELEIVEGKPPIKVATIHLSGGRFDDINSLEGNNYIIKIRQVMELIKREKPDIICGDLNTKLRPPEGEDAYFLSLPYNGKFVRDYVDNNERIQDWRAFYNSIYDHILNNTPLSQNISIYDKWYIWMYGLDFVFKDIMLASRLLTFPYSSAENNRDTTIFGGIVDMIYYNPQRMICESTNVVDGVIIPGQRILSDHAPVKATFSLIK